MAAEIRDRHPGADVTMIPSSKGRFEVTLNDAPIFEKSKLGRHAKPGEILTLIEAQQTSG